ncbi:hypothetical protein NMY22_g13071 [Coprinellus aureogranulatus]|nr:hypothetical protein NMY22_g13071 [Coprinellus aureogranulatus]
MRAQEAGTSAHAIVSESLERIRDGWKDDAFTEDVVQQFTEIFAHSYYVNFRVMPSWSARASRRSQAELDAVVKPGYLPDFGDPSSLPFIIALAKETLRWRGTFLCSWKFSKAYEGLMVPAVPHLPSTEDECRGYHFQRALIIPTAWATLHDKGVYEDPFTFKPDCFIQP